MRGQHSVPLFEGSASRRHRKVSYEELRRQSADALRDGAATEAARTFVQFAGFPRSGHTLVGAILDAHGRATISHELDALGLVEAGFSVAEVAALIAANAAAFRANGRHWNGYCYDIPDGEPTDAPPLVIGDKKGDWTVRRTLADPSLVARLQRWFPGRVVWINVVRNPFDNVATMSLRSGRHYDALRVAAATDGREVGLESLLSRDTAGRVRREVLPEMVEDYAELCRGVAKLKAEVPEDDWLELRHERLIEAPRREIVRLLDQLGLRRQGLPARAARHVLRQPNATRHAVVWSEDARRAVAALTERYDFLEGYAFGEAPRRALRRRAPSPDVPRPGGEPPAAVAPPVSKRDTRPTPAAGPAEVRLISCIGVADDLLLLPHFIAHYRALGVKPAATHVILQSREPGDPRLAAASEELARHGLPDPEVWIGPYTSGEMWQRRRALQSEVAAADDWIVSADVDELHTYPEGLAASIAWLEEIGATVLQGPMIDRIAADGRLAEVVVERSLAETFPLEGDLMCSVAKRPERRDEVGTVKVMLCRGDLMPGLGGHGVDQEATRREADAHGRRPRRTAFAYRAALARFPRIKDASFRCALPFKVLHYKWHAGLRRSLERRLATPGVSSAGALYGEALQAYLEPRGWRIDVADLARPTTPPEPDWRAVSERLRAAAQRLARSRARHGERTANPVVAGPGCRVRQLTFGSGGGLYHAHSYYDIPVLHEPTQSIAAFRTAFAGRHPTAEDAVEVGLVDAIRGGFHTLGTSRAWSWQQGPMAQWLPDGRLVHNDRDGPCFVARIVRPREGGTDTVERPVYALTPDGSAALSLNMARLEVMRPGYGYAGGEDARADEPCPHDDGVWRLDLAGDGGGRGGGGRLVLSLRDAVNLLREAQTDDERNEHAAADYRYWFNHAKIDPTGRRFTVKLRWRPLSKPWRGTMSVSMTCGLDGSAPRVLVRAASHVIWLDQSRLYLWNQVLGRVELLEDRSEADRGPPEILGPDVFVQNVHLRHVPDDARLMVYDTPYAETVGLNVYDRTARTSAMLARFAGHVPHHGPFRCDLHPVPSRDGRTIVVTSLRDGGRQLYLVERPGSGTSGGVP